MGQGKKYQPERVTNLLRQIEVAVANGKTTALACKEAGIVELYTPRPILTWFRARSHCHHPRSELSSIVTEQQLLSVKLLHCL